MVKQGGQNRTHTRNTNFTKQTLKSQLVSGGVGKAAKEAGAIDVADAVEIAGLFARGAERVGGV